MWQTIYDDYHGKGFVVIAVAMDNDIEAARPWIEEAKPTYPVLIDRYHRLAELYNMVNVPQAVWIDEQGRIVRQQLEGYPGFLPSGWQVVEWLRLFERVVMCG